MNPTTENYTPGHTPSATAFLAARDLDSHGFFLAPLLQPGFDVLDAGCGPGTITTGIAEMVFPGRVTAVDLSAVHLETGRRLAQGREIMNLDFVAASACEMPFADNSFDVVFSHALLEHLPAPERAMAEFHRVTRPGGFIGICCPDWGAIEVDDLPKQAGLAIRAYRDLQETHGGNTRAGAQLPKWLTRAGFTPLACDGWIEDYEDAGTFAEYLAQPLAATGQLHHATALREWAAGPEARFRLAWRYVIGVRADEARFHRHGAE
jgi:ubiquinone/menaquinone biosynthesis C-methylase UbiE